MLFDPRNSIASGCSTLPADRFDYKQLNTVTRAQVEAVHGTCLQTAYDLSGQYIKVGLLTGGLNGLLAGALQAGLVRPETRNHTPNAC